MKYLALTIKNNPLTGNLKKSELVAIISHKRKDQYYDTPNSPKIVNALINYLHTGLRIGTYGKISDNPLVYQFHFTTGQWDNESNEKRFLIEGTLTETELY